MSRLPLGRKAYGSIGHLPGSRTGPGDHHLDPAQAAQFTVRCPPGGEVLVQEKLDGSCVCAARVGGEILALGREGALAERSPNEARRMWARWVDLHRARFLAVLDDGERLVGEWLALAHGTRYDLAHEPFVAFDLMRGDERAAVDALALRAARGAFCLPALLHRGPAIAAPDALRLLGPRGRHGAVDEPEGVVYRLERGALVEVAKFVRPGKIDGALLPENSGRDAIWNFKISSA